MWTGGGGARSQAELELDRHVFLCAKDFNTVYVDDILILYLFLSSDLLYFKTEAAKLQSIVLTYNNNVLGRR